MSVRILSIVLCMVSAFAQAPEVTDTDYPALMARGLAALQARDFN